MRNVLITVATVLLTVSWSYAGIEVLDAFNHADGDLVGNSPAVGGTWAAHSGAGAVAVQVNSGAIALSQGSGSREDVNVPFANGAIGAGDTYYAAFDLTVPEITASVTNVYFAHFLTGSSSFGSRVWMTAGTDGGYRLAFSGGSSIETTWATDLAFDTTHRIVIAYDYDNATTTGGTLWVNPLDESSTSISTTSGFQNAHTAFAFRQSSGNTTQVIDNLIVATTFAEAVIPEPASMALLGLGGLVMLARRRRA